MRIRIERLRVWLLASAGLLVVVIAGFIGTARYLRQHWLGIPARLGANVKIDTSGITKSFTHDGQTDYVVHAGKYTEHEDGKAELHNVWIKLCGRKQQRADMVRGDDWEWDQKAGVIRALGVVHIELRDAEGKPACTAVDDSAAADAVGGKTLRVTTSNLVYMNKLGVAATSAPIEFASGTLTGHAVGADYASDTGTLMLHSAVSMTGMSAGQPVELNAASAEMDGQERVVRLAGARYTSGADAGGRTASAEQAVLYLRTNQTLERIEAQGDVTMQANGGTVSSPKADVAMNAMGHPVHALLTGGVRYAVVSALVERQGEAQQVAITFDGKTSPQAQSAVFTGAVHFVEKDKPARATDPGRSATKTRELSAATLEVALAPDSVGKSEVRDTEATGGAKFSEVSVGTGANVGTTQISADDLKAHFAAAKGAAGGSAPQLETIAGRGHTLVRQVDAKGMEQTSAGDTLDAKFHKVAGNKKSGMGSSGANLADVDALTSAVQTGHVVVTHDDPAKSTKGSGNEERATAERASYDGDSGRMTLNGGVQLVGEGSQLWASQAIVERATGDAVATGGVKAEFTQSADASTGRGRSQANEEPAHVLAERAELDHATDVVTFHGAPARMWQSGSQVQAPVIEMDKAAKRLIARGENATGWAAGTQGAQVHTVLMSAGGGQATPAADASQACAANASAGKTRAAEQPQVVRVASGALVYSQILNEADFTGGFRADTADATIRASAGTVLLKRRVKEAGAAQSVPSLEGNVDRVMATGQVSVSQPALHAAGGRLVYTAADQNFLLTGDAKNPPTATDERGSTTTGAALKFHRGCGATGDTVEVLSVVPGELGGPATQVHTESRVDVKREKAAQ